MVESYKNKSIIRLINMKVINKCFQFQRVTYFLIYFNVILGLIVVVQFLYLQEDHLLPLCKQTYFIDKMKMKR